MSDVTQPAEPSIDLVTTEGLDDPLATAIETLAAPAGRAASRRGAGKPAFSESIAERRHLRTERQRLAEERLAIEHERLELERQRIEIDTQARRLARAGERIAQDRELLAQDRDLLRSERLTLLELQKRLAPVIETSAADDAASEPTDVADAVPAEPADHRSRRWRRS